LKFDYSIASEKGLRSYQEDTKFIYWVPEEGYLLAVFDGHGGSAVAEHCAKRLVPLWNQIRNSILVANFENIVKEIFFQLNRETENMGSGAAASIAFIPESGTEVIVGILGDAPVLVRKADGTIWLSPEHNVRTNRAEADAAIKRGGFIQSGYLFVRQSGSGLQMSRALGDRYLGTVLNREPEVFRLPLGPGSFVLVASDGVFDPSHSTNQSQAIADKILNGASAKDLVDAALAVPTRDNVTAILVELSSEEVLPVSSQYEQTSPRL
jgi:serine/threonine protein phosphatase PrpC